MSRTVPTGIMIALTFALVACTPGNVRAPAADAAPAVANAGFLSDYSRLRAVDGLSGTYRFIDESADLRRYNKIAIDPVQVIVAPDADADDLPADVIRRMAESVRTEFVGALLSGYYVVNAPGPDVIRVRMAITGVQATRPDLGATDFIPIKAVFNIARNVAGDAPRVAEMSAEMEVLDPRGKVVGAALSTRKADKTLAQGERVSWKDMQAIAAVWAKNLRQHLDYQRNYAVK